MATYYDINYDGFSYRDNGLVIENISHFSVNRQNQIDNIANRPGGVLVQSQVGTKSVSVSGTYTGSTPEDAHAMYDTLVAAHNRQERILLIPHNSGFRRYTATPNNLVIQEPDGLNRLTYSVEFVVAAGYAMSDIDTTFVSTTVTTTTAAIPVSILGTEKARPFITLTFTTVTGGTGATVSLRNAKDFIGLSFTRNFVSGDVITIDSANFQTYINGVLTAPNGRMPTWDPGSGSIYYSDTFTTRSVVVTGTYKQKNL